MTVPVKTEKLDPGNMILPSRMLTKYYGMEKLTEFEKPTMSNVSYRNLTECTIVQQCFIRRQRDAIYRRVEQIGAATYSQVHVLRLGLHTDVLQPVGGTSILMSYTETSKSERFIL